MFSLFIAFSRSIPVRTYLFAIFVFSLLSSCSKPNPSQNDVTEESGITLVSISPSTGYLGEHPSSITYPFQIGLSEISSRYYYAILNDLKTPTDSLNSDIPVVNVSFYDAVYFCNKLSNQSRLDSVYTYNGIERDSSGSITSLSSLKINYSANGYRLPSEAEWELAARGTNGLLYPWGNDTTDIGKYAWYAGNSNGTIHPSCSTALSSSPLCDAAGNVMEWVNDWMGPLPQNIPADYIGPIQPSNGMERIVKGGSFRSSSQSIRATTRRDTYGVFGSTKTPYIGFRVARGVNLNPKTNSTSFDSTNSTPEIIATKDNVLSFFGTNYVRAIWSTENGTLQWIDFSEDPVIAHTIHTAVPAYHPTFSADGKWIAWCTKKEGQRGNSKIFTYSIYNTSTPTDSITQESAAIPRWWKDSTNQEFLVYVSSAASNTDSVEWSKSSTSIRPITNGRFTGPAYILSNEGAFHGGLSESGKSLATSYTSFFYKDLSTQKISRFFLSPKNGKDQNGSNQVCNLSTSPSGIARYLFLDFGDPKKNQLIGSSYNIHEYIFQSDSVGSIKWWLQAPKGREGWDYTEWSNENTFAISASFGATESRDRLHAINIDKKSIIDLLQGYEFVYPSLWVIPMPKNSTLAFDSLFQYSTPYSEYKFLFQLKTLKLWQMRDQLETALVGSSRILHGIDPDYLTNTVALNLGYSGADLHSSIRQIREYLLPHCPKLNRIIISLDIDLLFQLPTWFDIRIGDSPGYQFDRNHKFWNNGIPAGFDAYLNQIPMHSDIVTNLGLGIRQGKSWGSSEQTILGQWSEADDPVQNSLDSLEVLIKDLSQKHIQVIAVIFPQNPAFKDKETHYLYGPATLLQEHQIEEHINLLTSKYPQFSLIDFHNHGNHDFGPEFADNEDHLNIWGAKKLTIMLNNLLTKTDANKNLPTP